MGHEDFEDEDFAEGLRFERNQDFIFRRIASEAVLVPVRQPVAVMDRIYTINETGALVWEKLDRPTTQAELQAAILEEYAAPPEAVALDLSAFLLQLLDIGAVRPTVRVTRSNRSTQSTREA